MKKIAIILISILLIGGVTFYFISTTKKELAIEDILPQEAQMYIYFDNVEDNLSRIGKSQLWQSISNINYEELVKNEMLDPAQMAAFQNLYDKLSDPQTQLLLSRFFGDEFAFAIYPLPINLSQVSSFAALTTPSFLDDALSNFMIVSRVTPDVQLAEYFSGFVRNLGANTTQETLNYKDFTIHTIVFGQLQFRLVYVRIKDLLVISLSERAAQKIIDVYTNDLPALSEDKLFAKSQEQTVKDDEIFVYWDMEQFFEFIKSQMEGITALLERQGEDQGANQANVTQQIDESLKAVAGFKTFVLSGRLDSITEMRFNMLLDPANLSSELSHYYTCDPVVNKTLAFTPRNVLGYQWNSCIDLDYYWKQLLNEIDRAQTQAGTETPSVAEQVQQIETLLGLSIERDLLPAFGDEFGGFLEDIQLNGVFPIPKFLLFAEMKSKQKVEIIMKLLTQNPLFLLQEENYSGINIKYFTSPLGGEELQPSYCYLDNYLLIAINRKILKNSIDAKRDQTKSLSANVTFREIDKGLTDKNLNVYFAQMASFANKLEDIIEWANNWTEAQQQQREALKAGSQQRLQIVLNDIEQMQEDIISLESDVESTKKKISDRQAEGLSAEAFEEELKNLSKMIEDKLKDKEVLEDQQEELEQLVKSYENSGINSQKRELFLQKLVYPLLSGLSSIDSFGGRTTINGELFESSLLMKINY